MTEEGGRESTEWRYRLEPVDGGVRVTESYVVWSIPTWARIVDVPTNRAASCARPCATHSHSSSRPPSQRPPADAPDDTRGRTAYVLGADHGEPLWFADALVTYKATGDQTRGGRRRRDSGTTGCRLTASPARPRRRGVVRPRRPLHLLARRPPAHGRRGRLRLRARGMSSYRLRVDSDEAHFLLLLTPSGFEHFTRACGSPATALHRRRPICPTATRPCRGHGRTSPILSFPTPPHQRQESTVITTYRATPDIDVDVELPRSPGFGLVPINAFVMHGGRTRAGRHRRGRREPTNS